MKKSTHNWSLKTVINNCENTSLQQTAVSPRYQESVFTFCHGGGINGKINTLITPEMEISKMDINSTNDITLIQDDAVERFVCTFVNKGNIRSVFTEANTTLEQKKQQHSFVHAKASEGGHTIASGNTSIMYLNVRPGLLQTFVPDWQQFIGKLHSKKEDKNFYASPALPIKQDSRLQHIVAMLYNDTFTGITRNLYTEAKTLELLALQIEILLQHTDKELLPCFTLNSIDKEKLTAVREYITNSYLQPLSLCSLGKQFLLNEFKLKKGFKQLYNQSVFNYIHTLRMKHARELLQGGSTTVNEVSDLVGYSSIHNFSNAFYKMFCYRPSSVKALVL